jgi:AcrR family transcriptional regulator
MPENAQKTTREKSERQVRKERETREKIFRSAIRLFSERGLNNVTVEQITEAADVGKGTFFNYFQSKEAVLTYFGGLQLERLQRALAQGKLPDSPRERILEMLCLLARYEGWTPALGRGLFVSSLSHTGFAHAEGPPIWEVRRILAAAFAEGQEDGLFRDDVLPADAAQYLLGQHFLALLVWCVESQDQSLPAITERFGSLALDALTAGAAVDGAT